MMSVLEYSLDVNKSVSYVLKKCKELGIKVSLEDDLLSDEDITILDNALDDDVLETEEMISNNFESLKESPVKKKKVKDNVSKKSFAQKKKEMYKNKEKLKSNTSLSNDKVVFYKENMTISEFASALGVNSSEIIKKLFSLG